METSHGVASKNEAGFTLVELLVVIAIISLLAALLVPTLRRSVEEADFVKCQSQLRQIGIATATYGCDWNDALPPARDYPVQGALSNDGKYWTYYYGSTTVCGLYRSWMDRLDDVMGTDESNPIWLCPVRPVPDVYSQYGSYSYGYNYGNLESSYNKSLYGTGWSGYTDSGRPLSTCNINHPGKKVYVTEGIGGIYNDVVSYGDYAYEAASRRWVWPLHFYNGGGSIGASGNDQTKYDPASITNQLMCDFHVQSKTVGEHPDPDAVGNPIYWRYNW